MVQELPQTPESPSRLTPEDIQAFIQATYPNKGELKEIKKLQKAAISREKMPKNCRLVINMPVFYQEKNLKHALQQYLNQDIKDYEVEFEVAVHINGPSGVDVKESMPYQQAVKFQQDHPNLRLVITTKNYGKEQTTISRIRKDLAATSLLRAGQTEGVDLDNLILVTHDADLQGLDPNYLSRIVREFDRNPSLNGLAGFYDYPKEDFHQDHLFYTVQRFHDMVDIVNASRENVKIFKGGASAFRTCAYIEAGGIGHKRKMSELRPVAVSMGKQNPKATQFSRELGTVTTSARRQLMAIGTNIPLSRSHDSFGEQGDLAERYQVPAEELRIPEVANKVTSPDFLQKLQNELNCLYLSQVCLKKNVDRTQKLFRLVGVFAGIKIDFDEKDQLVIKDITVLRERLIKTKSSY